jgi:hypothetical protein
VAVWFQIAIAMHVIYWAIFFSLLLLTVTGVPALLSLLFFFTGPFVASALWAIRRSGSGGTTRPLPQRAEQPRRIVEGRNDQQIRFMVASTH